MNIRRVKRECGLHKDTNPGLTEYYSTEDKISGSNGVILVSQCLVKNKLKSTNFN